MIGGELAAYEARSVIFWRLKRDDCGESRAAPTDCMPLREEFGQPRRLRREARQTGNRDLVGNIPNQKGNVGRRGLGLKNREGMYLSLL